jgi:hypothetical protein
LVADGPLKLIEALAVVAVDAAPNRAPPPLLATPSIDDPELGTLSLWQLQLKAKQDYASCF